MSQENQQLKKSLDTLRETENRLPRSAVWRLGDSAYQGCMLTCDDFVEIATAGKRSSDFTESPASVAARHHQAFVTVQQYRGEAIF